MTKTAIVTGGIRGIGLAIVKRLAKNGHNISVIGRSSEVDDAVNALKAEGISIFYMSGDVSSKTSLEEFVKQTIATFGGIDFLVNNAGVAPAVRTDLLDMTEESFDCVIGVNLKGALMLSQLVAKHMIAEKKQGVIVNVASISSYVSSINRGEYCISKAGVSMLTMLLADRLAMEGIHVYEVRPGIIETDMTSGVKGKYDHLIDGGLLPIKRWGTPSDVAEAVAVLCEGRLAYSTGDIINVDGGFHIRRI